MGNYAGVDWASEKHDALVCDGSGEKPLAATFEHDEAGVRSLCSSLVRLKVALVGIERPDGLLVERLLDAGLRVLVMHPNQVAAARARFRTSGGKSDRFDAFVICELTRTDHHRFRVLEPDSDETKALRTLTRAPSLPSSCETASAVGLLSLRARTDVMSCRSSHQRWIPGQSPMPPVEERREP